MNSIQVRPIGTQPLTVTMPIPDDEIGLMMECGSVFFIQSIDFGNGIATIKFLPGNGVCKIETEKK